MKRFLKRLFCRHNYRQIFWYPIYDPHSNMRYPMRIYRCNKCNKEIEVDGRYDRIRCRY